MKNKPIPFLLDVNVLIALFDPMHVAHDLVHEWFGESGRSAWASCPLTENGFIRIVCHPKYLNTDLRPSEAISILQKFTSAEAGHQFWNDDLSLIDEAVFDPDFVASHKMVTDIYLVGLAHAHKGRLATLDHRIDHKGVRGANASAIEKIA